jgi:serine/threonine protein kinase/tetratricopeptide (TPR) repeat protein
MKKRSTFGAKPDQLGRLLTAIGLEKSPAKKQDMGAPTVPLPAPPRLEPIGGYKLLRLLGEGGMGMVYLAEQAGPIRRKVALKVIKPGMDSKRVITRFEAERQALALLDHPNVAQVYDAGTTESGRPYFAMEYVKGMPITEYCDRHRLSIEDRLRLFQQVCLAVHHAHQKGIIHRDLKPSNILVSAENDRPTPKIIDFGVAKAMSQPLTERTLFTEDSHLLGTPEYMSPEQADMVNEDIDIRSDIYSLGVLLYVLLAGILPYDSETFRRGGIEHIRKTIRETDPKTPSTRLTKLGEEAKKLAESRRTEVATLAKRLHTELEWIPLKAMRKERAERYRSASEMADDIENYLTGAPLIAGPPGTGYKLKKLVQRNRVLVGGVAAVLVVLIAGIVISTNFAIGQARASAEAQLVASFLNTDVLRSARDVKGREATVVDILNAAVARLDEGRFRNQPLVEASIRGRLCMTYYDLGYYALAAQHQEPTPRIYAEQLGENHIKTKVALNWLAVYYYYAGKYREAEPLYKRIVKQVHEHSMWNCNLATTYAGQGRYEEAGALLRECLEDVNWATQRTWAQYGLHLGEIYREQGQYEAAERVVLKTLEACRQGQEEGADRTYDNCMVRCLNELALLHLAQQRYEKAEELFERGIDLGERALPGQDHPFTLRHVNGLGVLRTKQHLYEAAETLFNRALEGRKRKLGEDHPYTLETIHDFGVLRREQQRYEEAESLLLQALHGRQRKLGNDHPVCFESMHELAVLYIRQARDEDAERLLLDAFHGRETKLGPEHPYTIESLQQLVTLYESWHKPDEAAQWRAKLAEMKATEG